MKVLKVATGHVHAPGGADGSQDWLDYRVYDRIPRLWRRLEEAARLDFYLALRARRLAAAYDVVWAASEKVGIPLSLLNVGKPVVTLTHAVDSLPKRLLLRALAIPRRWAAVGVTCAAGGDFVRSYFGVERERVFAFLAAPLRNFTPGPGENDIGILSLGVAGRDYTTLLNALADLPQHRTLIHVHSRHGDRYRGRALPQAPRWVCFSPPIATSEMPGHYRDARFVVLPLRSKAHIGAGLTVALEAAASGRAVIATATPGTRCAIVDGETGLLVPAHDTAALRAAIRRLWSDPTTAAAMGQAARQHVERHFNPIHIEAGIRSALARIRTAAPL